MSWGFPCFGAGYNYTRLITIDHTKVSTSDQTQFPFVVCANSSAPCNATIAGLNQSGAGAHVQNSNGYDIIFTSDSACLNKLTWELEKYVPSTGELVAWVTNTITPLSHTSDTVMYMCYGNPTISTFQSTASAVWDSNYKAVYHMANASGQLTDSTANGNSTITSSSLTYGTAGAIDGAITYSNASNSKASPGNPTSLQITGNLTLEAWTKASSSGSNDKQIIAKFDSSSTEAYVLTSSVNVNRNVAMFVGVNSTTDAEEYGGTTLVDGTAYFLAGTYSTTGPAMHVYVNGIIDDGQLFGTVPASIFNPTSNVVLGSYGSDTIHSFNGILDELRISNTTRSASWIATDQNTWSNPNNGSGQFYSVGSEVSNIVMPVFSFIRKITVDHTKVSNFDQPQFPILFCANSASPCQATVSGLNQSGAGAHVQNANGYDIIFTTDSNCSHELNWDLEKYTASTGEIIAWISNPLTALSSSTDTVFYMCYGSSTISSPQYTPSLVWDSNYAFVLHLSNGSALSLNDSTGLNTFSNIATATATTGEFDGGMAVNGSTQYAESGSTFFATTSVVPFSVEAWAKPAVVNITQDMWQFGETNNSNNSLHFGLSSTHPYYTNDNTSSTSTLTASSGSYQFFGLNRTATQCIFYLNNTTNTQSNSSNANVGNNGIDNHTVGAGAQNAVLFAPFDGSLDEVRVSNISRSSDWFATDYNSMSNPNNGAGEFYSLGSEQNFSLNSFPIFNGHSAKMYNTRIY